MWVRQMEAMSCSFLESKGYSWIHCFDLKILSALPVWNLLLPFLFIMLLSAALADWCCTSAHAAFQCRPRCASHLALVSSWHPVRTGQVLPERPVRNTSLAPLARFSSVQLLGDLLFHISGVTGKMTTETASEDDNFGTAQSNKVKLFLPVVPFYSLKILLF